ncbi:MAG: hypothetical protein BGO57_08415 [Sphingomonadales bacterium 63-6]|nr:MAG: hypothetical protein BGO57_08415 [Sphingomonadales bacterium 63-6]
MGPINYTAVFLGALAFFAVGAAWYSLLFGKAWQKLAGLSEEQIKGANMPMIFGLCFVAELVISWMLGHQIARTSPPPHVIMMFALGFAGALMIPAIAINYLFQRKPLKLFLIDSGHFLVGMAAMGAVHLALY